MIITFLATSLYTLYEFDCTLLCSFWQMTAICFAVDCECGRSNTPVNRDEEISLILPSTRLITYREMMSSPNLIDLTDPARKSWLWLTDLLHKHMLFCRSWLLIARSGVMRKLSCCTRYSLWDISRCQSLFSNLYGACSWRLHVLLELMDFENRVYIIVKYVSHLDVYIRSHSKAICKELKCQSNAGVHVCMCPGSDCFCDLFEFGDIKSKCNGKVQVCLDMPILCRDLMNMELVHGKPSVKSCSRSGVSSLCRQKQLNWWVPSLWHSMLDGKATGESDFLMQRILKSRPYLALFWLEIANAEAQEPIFSFQIIDNFCWWQEFRIKWVESRVMSNVKVKIVIIILLFIILPFTADIGCKYFSQSENDHTCREAIDKEFEKNTASTASALEEIA